MATSRYGATSATLPDATALGSSPSLRGDRPIASPDTTAIGQGMQAFGADLFQTGNALNAGWKAQEDADAYSKYLAFVAQEDLGWQKATTDLKPEQAKGFAGSYIGMPNPDKTAAPDPNTYAGRSKAFLDSLPARVRQTYGDRLGVDAIQRIKAAQGVELAEQKRQANATLDSSIDQSLMPRVEYAAGLPRDDPAKGATLNRIIADGDAAIDATPGLTPIEKATAKQKWHEKAQTGFANALPSDEKATVDPNSAGTQLGDAPIWGKALDAVPYATKLAIAHDGYAQYVQEETARRMAAAAADKARYNAYENAVLDGKWGLADLHSAVNSGQLSDAGERAHLTQMITERDRDGLNLAVDNQKITYTGPGAYVFSPQSTDDKNTVKRWYAAAANGGQAMPGDPANGAQHLLDAPTPDLAGGAEGLVGRQAPGNPNGPAQQAQSAAIQAIRRTGIVPPQVVDQLQGGMRAADPGYRQRAYEFMGAVAENFPSAATQSFTEADLNLYDRHMALVEGMTPEELAKAENPADPETRAIHDQFVKDAKTVGASINFADEIGNLYYKPGFAGTPLGSSKPGEPSDPRQLAVFNREATALFAESYADTYGNVDKAKELTLKRLGRKWGPTDVGSGGPVLMAYPPERYARPSANGDLHWMDTQLEATVRAAEPKAQTWGISEGPQTETEVKAGQQPHYLVWYTVDGVTTFIKGPDGAPIPKRFDDREANKLAASDAATKRDAFAAKQAADVARQDAMAGDAARRALPAGGAGQYLIPPDEATTRAYGTGQPLDYGIFGSRAGFVQRTVETLARQRGMTPEQVLREPALQNQLIELAPDLAQMFDKFNAPGQQTSVQSQPNGIQVADASGAIPQSAIDRFNADSAAAKQVQDVSPEVYGRLPPSSIQPGASPKTAKEILDRFKPTKLYPDPSPIELPEKAPGVQEFIKAIPDGYGVYRVPGSGRVYIYRKPAEETVPVASAQSAGVQVADASGAVPQSSIDQFNAAQGSEPRFTADEWEAQQAERAKATNPIGYFMNSPVVKAFRKGWDSVPPSDPHAALFKEFFGKTDAGNLTQADVKRAFDNAMRAGRFGQFSQLLLWMRTITEPILRASEPGRAR